MWRVRECAGENVAVGTGDHGERSEPGWRWLIPTNMSRNIYLYCLKLNGLFLTHCLICYLKASKKHVLAVNNCTVAFVYVCISPFTVYM